ncbi:hypothetical protein MHBO_003504, partial [Bonamia ostreae]
MISFSKRLFCSTQRFRVVKKRKGLPKLVDNLRPKKPLNPRLKKDITNVTPELDHQFKEDMEMFKSKIEDYKKSNNYAEFLDEFIKVLEKAKFQKENKLKFKKTSRYGYFVSENLSKSTMKKLSEEYKQFSDVKKEELDHKTSQYNEKKMAEFERFRRSGEFSELEMEK